MLFRSAEFEDQMEGEGAEEEGGEYEEPMGMEDESEEEAPAPVPAPPTKTVRKGAEPIQAPTPARKVVSRK